MVALLTNPIMIAIIVILVLCFVKVNAVFSLAISSLIDGLLPGVGVSDTIGPFTEGAASNGETALSYVLLGTIAVTIERRGLTAKLSGKIGGTIKGSKIRLLAILIFTSFLSQTFIPIHIAFMSIIIPAMLVLVNQMKLDRRLVSCALAFDLKGTWITFPIGFDLIFHAIVSQNMTKFDMPIAVMDVWHCAWFLGLSTAVGFIVAYSLYKKPREYVMEDIGGVQEEIVAEDTSTEGGKPLTKTQQAVVISVTLTVMVQPASDSIILGALAGPLLFLLLDMVKMKGMGNVVDQGISIMGFMAFVMLTATGFGNVLSSSGQVDTLVQFTISVVDTNRLVIAVVPILVGLVLTIGTGFSFGTVPILAALYIPFAQVIGFSVGATVILIVGAATMGETDSPASDSTLGSAAGLNTDGRRDHIRDSRIPQIITLVSSALVFGIVGAMVFQEVVSSGQTHPLQMILPRNTYLRMQDMDRTGVVSLLPNLWTVRLTVSEKESRFLQSSESNALSEQQIPEGDTPSEAVPL